MDIYIKAQLNLDNAKSKNLQIIIENKVDSTEHDKQTHEYHEWCTKETNDGETEHILAMYLTPSQSNQCSDKRYIHVTYQQLTDFVLAPLTDIPKTKNAEVLLDEYLRNLSRPAFLGESTTKKRTIMATTQEEKELIRNFYNNNQDLMMAIIEVLASDDDIQLNEDQREALQAINARTVFNRDPNNYEYKGVKYSVHTDKNHRRWLLDKGFALYLIIGCVYPDCTPQASGGFCESAARFCSVPMAQCQIQPAMTSVERPSWATVVLSELL